jgi:hypothetical protein
MVNFLKTKNWTALIGTMAILGFSPYAVLAENEVTFFFENQSTPKNPSNKTNSSDIVFFDVAPSGVTPAGSVGDYSVALTSDLFRSKIDVASTADVLKITSDPKLFKQVKKGDQVQAIFLGEASKVQMPTKIGRINLSKVMSLDHFDNYMNLPVKASSVAEGNASVIQGILFFRENAIYHIDPANGVLNVSGISAQQSLTAHSYVQDVMAQFGDTDKARETVFASGEFLKPALEYSTILKDYMVKSPMYRTDASTSDLMNGWDITVQAGPGAGKDYDKVYLETLNWKRADCIKYLKSSGLGNITTIYNKKVDVTKWPDDVLKTFTIRVKTVWDLAPEYGFKGARRSDGSAFGLGAVAIKNGLTDQQQVMNDQGRRVWDMRLVYDKDQFEAVAKAPVSTFVP